MNKDKIRELLEDAGFKFSSGLLLVDGEYASAKYSEDTKVLNIDKKNSIITYRICLDNLSEEGEFARLIYKSICKDEISGSSDRLDYVIRLGKLLRNKHWVDYEGNFIVDVLDLSERVYYSIPLDRERLLIDIESGKLTITNYPIASIGWDLLPVDNVAVYKLPDIFSMKIKDVFSKVIEHITINTYAYNNFYSMGGYRKIARTILPAPVRYRVRRANRDWETRGFERVVDDVYVMGKDISITRICGYSGVHTVDIVGHGEYSFVYSYYIDRLINYYMIPRLNTTKDVYKFLDYVNSRDYIRGISESLKNTIETINTEKNRLGRRGILINIVAVCGKERCVDINVWVSVTASATYKIKYSIDLDGTGIMCYINGICFGYIDSIQIMEHIKWCTIKNYGSITQKVCNMIFENY